MENHTICRKTGTVRKAQRGLREDFNIPTGDMHCVCGSLLNLEGSSLGVSYHDMLHSCWCGARQKLVAHNYAHLHNEPMNPFLQGVCKAHPYLRRRNKKGISWYPSPDVVTNTVPQAVMLFNAQPNLTYIVLD